MLTDQQIDEFLEMLAKSPTSARYMVRGLFATHEAKAAPAVPMSESQRADMICAVAAICTGTSSRTVAATAIEWVERYYGITTPAAPSQPAVPQGYALISVDALRAWGKLDEVDAACVYPTTPAAPSQEPGKCAQCKKPYRKGANTEGCPKCAPGVVVPESEFQKPISAPSQPVTCGNGCSCLVQCGDTYAHAGLPSPKEPVTLTDDDIARCINVATCGRPFIGLMNSGGVPSAFSRSLADLLIAALREKEQAT